MSLLSKIIEPVHQSRSEIIIFKTRREEINDPKDEVHCLFIPFIIPLFYPLHPSSECKGKWPLVEEGDEEEVKFVRAYAEYPVSVFDDKSSLNKFCSICLDDFDENDKVMTLECFHIFHSDCAARWLAEYKKCKLCCC